MNAYLCILELEDDNMDGLNKLGEQIMATWNRYTKHRKNTADQIVYRGDAAINIDYEDYESLYPYLITKDSVSFAKSYYDKEIENG